MGGEREGREGREVDDGDGMLGAVMGGGRGREQKREEGGMKPWVRGRDEEFEDGKMGGQYPCMNEMQYL